MWSMIKIHQTVIAILLMMLLLFSTTAYYDREIETQYWKTKTAETKLANALHRISQLQQGNICD